MQVPDAEVSSGGNGTAGEPKICVISYSLTGNNDALAESLARTLGAEHVRVTESGRRTMAKIVLDVIFNRSPRVQVPLQEMERYDLVLFVGPVWMGQVASPFRACFKELRSRIRSYAFVSVCGGADGPNPKLAGELSKRLNRDPLSVVELYIADILPPEPKPERKDTMAYRLNAGDVGRVTGAAVEQFHQYLSRRSNS
jgi:hypothetical protein